MRFLFFLPPLLNSVFFQTHLQGSKVDDTVNVRVRLEDLIESGLIGDVQLGELSLLARDQLNTLESLRRGIVQVIGDDDLVASLEQGKSGEGTNVTGTTKMRQMVGLAQGQEQQEQEVFFPTR